MRYLLSEGVVCDLSKGLSKLNLLAKIRRVDVGQGPHSFLGIRGWLGPNTMSAWKVSGEVSRKKQKKKIESLDTVYEQFKKTIPEFP